MSERFFLCQLEELTDPGSRGFTLVVGTESLAIVLVKLHGKLYAFRNRCPHTGVNLEWQADQFLDLSARYIQCATHGALFRPEDGYCVRGPCAGQRLRPVKLAVEKGGVYIDCF
jgi:nitrite reductase/ring-hydroxylating ferredoxin subunit